jgi:hypothetical protein
LRLCHFPDVNRSGQGSNTEAGSIKRQTHAGEFTKVLDGRKQPIRGLYVRNGRYYGRFTFEDENTGQKKTSRVPLLNREKQQKTPITA